MQPIPPPLHQTRIKKVVVTIEIEENVVEDGNKASAGKRVEVDTLHPTVTILPVYQRYAAKRLLSTSLSLSPNPSTGLRPLTLTIAGVVETEKTPAMATLVTSETDVASYTVTITPELEFPR